MELFVNRLFATLAAGIDDVTTTLPLTTGHGARFGTIGAGNKVRIVFLDASANVLEIAYITAISGDSATITRGQDGTSGVAHLAGDRVEARIGKSTMEGLLQVAMIHEATGKTTPVDADELPLADSAASFGLKKLTWANLKATLASTFAALAGSSLQVFSTGQMYAAAHSVRSDAIVGVMNLRIVAADTANNKLGIYAESSDGVPSATNPIIVAVPTVNGVAFRSREAGFLSGTDQISLSDAANYWSKGSLAAEIKTAWLYAIAPAAGGIVWALGGYSGFTRVPTTTTVTDDDYLHLEDGSTYTRAATDYCVCVRRMRYQYNTADTPDHTFQTTVLDAPQAVYNPRSDYTRTLTLAADNVSAADIADYSAVSAIVKQSGKYKIRGHVGFIIAQVAAVATAKIKTGSATYGSATQKSVGSSGLAQYNGNAGICTIPVQASVYLNAGDTIHLGAALAATTGSGNRTIEGDTYGTGYTGLTFSRAD